MAKKKDLIPKTFLNFYDRINSFVPPNIIEDVTAGKKSFKIDAYEVKLNFSKWMIDVFAIIDSDEGFSEKDRIKIKSIINAQCHFFRNGGMARKKPEYDKPK